MCPNARARFEEKHLRQNFFLGTKIEGEKMQQLWGEIFIWVGKKEAIKRITDLLATNIMLKISVVYFTVIR